MMAVYPDIEADPITQAKLLAAYVRRKRFEAKLIANEVGKLFATASEPERVSEDQMWSMMGIQPVAGTFDGNQAS